MGREDAVSAPSRAKETYHELSHVLPSLLPDYLVGQRWFGGKASRIRSAESSDLVPMGDTRFETFVLLVRLEYTTGPGETYVLPLMSTPTATPESAAADLTVHSPVRSTNLHLRNALADAEFLRGLLE